MWRNTLYIVLNSFLWSIPSLLDVKIQRKTNKEKYCGLKVSLPNLSCNLMASVAVLGSGAPKRRLDHEGSASDHINVLGVIFLSASQMFTWPSAKISAC